jgi:hypothetical protein
VRCGPVVPADELTLRVEEEHQEVNDLLPRRVPPARLGDDDNPTHR